jgi:hypothetical protein
MRDVQGLAAEIFGHEPLNGERHDQVFEAHAPKLPG